MIYFYFVIIIIVQLRFYREYKFKYSYNTVLLTERIKRGKEAFDEILKAKRKAEEEYKKKTRNSQNENIEENIYVKEIKCYEYVLEQLNNLNMYNCNEINENNKSLLALAKTRCIFVKSIRNFPDENSGCVLNTKKLSKLQIYLYNHNLFDEFQNENFPKSLSLDELKKIEKIKNPCETFDDINNSHLINDRPFLTEDNHHIYNKNNMPKEHILHEDMELKKKLCENLKYKIITNCTGNNNMSDVAFQIYHSELNHIDDICFYIQSTEWNKRTEENINKLAETSLYITRQMTTNLENMKLIENAQVKQIENTNRFDIFLKGLKNDFGEIIQILLKIKKHHESMTKFLRGFKIIVIYLLIILLVLFITSRNYAYNSRKKIITCVIFCYLTEWIFKKIITLIKRYILLNISQYIVNYSIKGIRYAFVIVCVKILIRTIISYKEPVKVIEEQLNDIKKIVEKNQQNKNSFKEIKTEGDFKDKLDQETINILNLWSNYNDYLDSLYSNDSDFNTNLCSDSEFSSSETSFVSEHLVLKEIDEVNDDPIGKRIKKLHRKNRPIFFHYFPSPKNVKAYTENPISFTNMVEYNHNEVMRMRENRIKNFSNNNSNETIILENDDSNLTYNLYDSNEHDVKINKFYSLDSLKN
ncbi:nuclear fusion protein, putative [Plasmodium gallinaceum]|uniref:Nuclear fusion protein, putative n=1 Tax=Plasmodium gallinaceum TaxID=5849 RepID=A0A1J1GNU6_PLAGA|nr:nuclear fusion protein, putative [Plasmodium gallinaceum]CRG93996.1 nuclear fusion protein, putative [Plasmodium gallinaceum]